MAARPSIRRRRLCREWRGSDWPHLSRAYINGEPKWRRFLQTVPAPPPNQGMADTLDEAKAALAKHYDEVKKGK
jgi:hypothetical protein